MSISYCYSEAHWDWMDGKFISTTELHRPQYKLKRIKSLLFSYLGEKDGQ